jgi:hypothetical protein
MRSCRRFRRAVDGWRGGAAGFPQELTAHLESCADCRRLVAAIRIARGAIAALAEGEVPPPQFVANVMRALRVRVAPVQGEGDLWRSAWQLVPAFAAVVLALFWWGPADLPMNSFDLLPLTGLSASERLVVDATPPAFETVAAVLVTGDSE